MPLAACGIGMDRATTFAPERLDLARQVLLLSAHARVADEPFRGFLFETDL